MAPFTYGRRSINSHITNKIQRNRHQLAFECANLKNVDYKNVIIVYMNYFGCFPTTNVVNLECKGGNYTLNEEDYLLIWS